MSVTYGSLTAIVIGLETTILDNEARASTFIDNATNAFDDALVRIRTNGQAGGTKTTDWYVYSSLGDADYTDGATGTDADFTTADRRNSPLLASIQMNAATQVEAGMFSVAALFGGTLPKRWGLIQVNRSGATLSTVAADHDIEYMGVTY